MCAICDALGYGECGLCATPTWDADDEGSNPNKFPVLARFSRKGNPVMIETCAYCYPWADEQT